MNSIVEGVQYEFKGTSDRDKFKAAIEAMLFASG